MSKEKPVNWLDRIASGSIIYRFAQVEDSGNKCGIGNKHVAPWHLVELADYGNMRFILWECLPLLELVGVDTALVESILVNKFHVPLESLRDAGHSLNEDYDVSKAAYYRYLRRQVRLIRIVLKNLGITEVL